MNTQELQKLANKLRLEAVRMVYEGKDGHPGPALSIADIVATLYFDAMNVDPKNPEWEDRDRFILSKGHACPIWYAALNQKGYFEPKVEHFHLRALGSTFQGHPSMHSTKGIDMTSGSLGNGIAIGAGMAAAAKIQKKDYFTYVICGDGELQEGVCWEGVNMATGRKLDNLVVIVDNNNMQIDGTLDEVCSPDPIDKKFEAFNFHVIHVADGNDFAQLAEAFKEARETKGMPTAIIAHTLKGKGVSYMEGQVGWHGKAPNDEEYAIAMEELGKAGEALCQK